LPGCWTIIVNLRFWTGDLDALSERETVDGIFGAASFKKIDRQDLALVAPDDVLRFARSLLN
jgi:hypothetical protein